MGREGRRGGWAVNGAGLRGFPPSYLEQEYLWGVKWEPRSLYLLMELVDDIPS